MRSLLVCALGVFCAFATPVAAYEETVDVFFMASFDSVKDNLEDFTKQFNVMLLRTNAVTSEDVTSVAPQASTDGNILVRVTVSSLQAAVAITTAVEGRHLSVYIDGKGYIAVIPHSVPVTSAPDATTIATSEAPATDAPAVTTHEADATTTVPGTTSSTEHPALKGYVWLSEFTSDNENLNDCSTGNPWSGVVISRMPVGCNRFQHSLTKQDEYNFLSLVDGKANFGMVCDTRCTSCISQVESYEYSSCVATWGGSVSMTSQDDGYCLGATYLDLDQEGQVSIFRFSEAGCDLDSNLDAKLYIRNYPPVSSGSDAEPTCTRDGTTNSYYALSKVADENGDVFFNGKLGCSDSDCSVGCTEVRSWQEGSCNRDGEGKGIQIWESSEVLKECAAASSDNTAGSQDHQAQAVAMAEVADYEQGDAEEEGEEEEEVETTSTGDATTAVEEEETTSTVKPTTERRERPTDAVEEEEEQEEANPMEGSAHGGENTQLLSVMIAAGGVMAVAFLVAGVLYTRRRRQQEIEDAIYEDDIYDEYDYNGYSKYDNCDDWDDDRLVTDI